MTNHIYQNTTVHGILDIAGSGTVGPNLLAAIRDAILPVGTIVSGVSTSPASTIGGTWERIEDVFILAAGDTYPAGSTGGEMTHELTVAETAKHWHKLVAYNDTGIVLSSERTGSNSALVMQRQNWAPYDTVPAVGQLVTSSTGGSFSSGEGDSLPTEANGNPHNNMPQYQSEYVWKRVA